MTEPILESRVKAGASWFLWIAILSVINSLVVHFEGNMSFVVGLGITQVFDAVAAGFRSNLDPDMSWSVTALALAADVLVAGLFILFWRLSAKGQRGAFVAGMALYALDGLIFLMVKDYLSMAFHAFALFRIFQGFSAAKEMRLPAAAAAPAETITPGRG